MKKRYLLDSFIPVKVIIVQLMEELIIVNQVILLADISVETVVFLLFKHIFFNLSGYESFLIDEELLLLIEVGEKSITGYKKFPIIHKERVFIHLGNVEF